MAKSVKALITPAVLKWARERRMQLRMNEAAERLKVNRGQLSDWEAGSDLPTFTQLKRIASAYRTHVSVFYLPQPPHSLEYPVDHRRFSGARAPDEEQAYRLNANIIEVYERRESLLEFYELLEESPPEVTLELDETDNPERAAQEIREFLQFNTGLLQQCNDDRATLKFWRERLEAKRILVCQTSVNTHLSIQLAPRAGFASHRDRFR